MPAVKPLAPPKPPEAGSSYIPDAHSAAPAGTGSSPTSGALGVPAPLPMPTPPSSPLASGSDKSAASAGAPVPQRTASNGPSVKVFDELEYVCKPGDSFESISKKYLLSENYTKALQLHNQQHARASELVQKGQLAPGERIFIPQAHILEERYAGAIPKPASPASSTTTPASFIDPSSPSPARNSPPPPPPPP